MRKASAPRTTLPPAHALLSCISCVCHGESRSTCCVLNQLTFPCSGGDEDLVPWLPLHWIHQWQGLGGSQHCVGDAGPSQALEEKAKDG